MPAQPIFTNSFTSGEICPDAWDRVDLQEVAKGCELASNLVIRITGPLGKRRGFWLNGAVNDPTKLTRLIPFRRSVADALMLEFGDFIAHVWQANGAPLISGGSQVSFVTPYSQAQLAGLRWKQVADVIYFRHASGLAPQSLTRASNTSWTFALETFPNGPWLPENVDGVTTITVSGGAAVNDANPTTNAAYMPVGQAVTMTASAAKFDANMVGSFVRLRKQAGEGAGVFSWAAAQNITLNWLVLSVGNIYLCTQHGANSQFTTNPPVHTSGSESDGNNILTYVGDGAGIVKITGYTSPTVVTGTVTAAIPFGNDTTTFWSLSAYSASKGWPRAWPSLREERLVNAATASTLDFIDLTKTAGFQPTLEDYHPGQGTGQVIATDAIRRRLGDDGGEILWTETSLYLMAGSISGEYLIAGSVLDEPLSASSVTIKQLSAYGSADVGPVRAHKGLIYVTRGQQTLREINVDTTQSYVTDDLTVLASHIGQRGFMQLAWILAPDETLWARMGDGGMASMIYHAEQHVRGFVSMTMPTGWICEDIAALPGPGGFETLWAVWSRTKNSATQRVIVMQSQPSDALFLDLAQAYAGAPTTSIGGLTLLEGETVRVKANGAQLPDQVVSNTGTITVPAGTTSVQVGYAYLARFKSLKLVPQGEPVANKRRRVAGGEISVSCVTCSAGLDGGRLEQISSRLQSDVPLPVAKRTIEGISVAGEGALKNRDPRIVIQDDSVFDLVIYSYSATVVVGD